MKLCAIQCANSDLIESIDTHNCISAIKASKLFDVICLVSPAFSDTRELQSKAELWGIDYFEGDVENVTKRFGDLVDHYQATVVTRVLPQWFFVDPQLIQRAIELVETHPATELIQLPNDFDIRFGGDTSKASFFRKADHLLNALSKNSDTNSADISSARFNPWGFAEKYPEHFVTETLNDVPTHDNTRHAEHRKIMRKIWPEHWHKTSMPNQPYTIAIDEAKTFGTTVKAVDLACGSGDGTVKMQNHGIEALGVDIDQHVIQHCQQRKDALPGNFVCSDYRDLNIAKNSIDLVVSIHTMEHIEDDRDFLSKIYHWLSPGGKLVVEVPLLMKRPYAHTTVPISPFHFREYDLQELKQLIREYFSIQKVYGISRGLYQEEGKARGAALIVCTKEQSQH